jgi:hypothetical protein
MNRLRIWQRYGLKTVTTLRQAGRLRIACLVAGWVAVLAMIVVGCSGVVTGTATVNGADAPAYRSSVSVSVEASASASSARESERQVAVTKQAVHTACDALGASSSESVQAVNAYVDAYNADAPDAPNKIGPAVDALNNSVDLVSSSLSPPLPEVLAKALNGWIDAARELASLLPGNPGPDEFNAAIRRLNDAKTAAGVACEAAY